MPLNTVNQHHLEALKASVDARHIGLKHISEATGVHISQVSRILSGKIKIESKNVEKICKFAKITGLHPNSTDSEELLFKAVKEVWDGTNEHAISLANFLTAINRYQVDIQRRSNNPA